MNKGSLILFLLMSLFLKAQSGIVSYSVELTVEKQSDIAAKLRAEMDLMEFTLSYDTESSYFEQEKNIPIDPLSSNLAKSILLAKGDYQQKSNKSLNAASVVNQDYLVDRYYRMSDWELTNESSKINNYTCYKAIHRRLNDRTGEINLIVAWYTIDIPIGYGPLGYGGLPGLILQLENNNATLIARKIILNPKDLKVSSLKKAEIITAEELGVKMRAARMVTDN